MFWAAYIVCGLAFAWWLHSEAGAVMEDTGRENSDE
jgi:hypothetical protein